MVEDNCILSSLEYNYNQKSQIELPNEHFQSQRTAKEVRRFCKEKGRKGRRDKKGKLKHTDG
jgi:hypothetical protein